MMNWLINLLFPKKTPVKQQRQAHYVRDSLQSVKQQQKHLQDKQTAERSGFN